MTRCVTLGMSARSTSAPLALSGHRRETGLQRRRQPVGEIRIVDDADVEAGERAAISSGPMPGDDDDGIGLRGERLLRDPADQRLAVEARQELVRPAHAARLAGGEDDRGDARARRRDRLARLRARHDLHQKTADAHAGDVLLLHRKSGEQAIQHPVESVLRRRACAARRAEHRAAVELAEEKQIAGIDRHAEMPDPAAGRLDRGGDNVGLVGDRRRAEGDQQVRPLAAQLARAPAARCAASCGTRISSSRVAPAGFSRSSRMRRVLSITDGFRPGSMVAASPTLSGFHGATESVGGRSALGRRPPRFRGARRG